MKKPLPQTDKGDKEKSLPLAVTAEGSLGLLALGAVGIKAWRKKRDEELSKQRK